MMIRLRLKPTEPDILKSEKVTSNLDRIADKVSNKEEITDRDFLDHIWRDDNVRLVLWKYQHEKCCYCERKRDPKGEPDIEHFRPKTKAGDDKPGYWWLAYDWDNLFFSCKRCNKKKSSKFPLLNKRRARSPKSKVKEKPVFPHPVVENPKDFIGFRWEFGTIPIAVPIGKDGDGRGSKTIKILGLDDSKLAEERGSFLYTLKALAVKMHAEKHFYNRKRIITNIEKEIKQETKANNYFTGFRREFFRSQDLSEHISND